MKFKAEDFAKWKPHALSGDSPDYADMADLANARLWEMLGEGKLRELLIDARRYVGRNYLGDVSELERRLDRAIEELK